MNARVVFYSRTGTTKKVGKALAELLRCNSEELIDTKKRKALLGFIRSGRDANTQRLTVLEPLIHDHESYDLVARGTPVWGGMMSSPIRTYITTNKSKFNRVAFFCTQGGTENERLFSDMEALYGKNPASVLALRGADVKKEDYQDKLSAFADSLNTE